ncbi:MAG: DUF374 domain-containing protein [Polyangiaceae bacterium]|nr:DUF374 domain-containing protein [Polyangiaceae bacterium]
MAFASLAHCSRVVAGCVIGLVARLWLVTLRVHVVQHPALCCWAQRPWVYALWHGQMMPLLAHRFRRRTVALVSLSTDGEVLAGALRVFGVGVERGSSSRGGRDGLRAVVHRLRWGCDAAFAVDGPRGPRGVAKPGCLAAAHDAQAVVVPFAACAPSAWRLSRAWDGFEIPVPFSRIVVVLGQPLPATACRCATSVTMLSAALDAACEAARRSGA